jgi:hypothetical protein
LSSQGFHGVRVTHPIPQPAFEVWGTERFQNFDRVYDSGRYEQAVDCVTDAALRSRCAMLAGEVGSVASIAMRGLIVQSI